MKGLQVRFWGTRGSVAAPYPDRMRYGGNTSCTSVEWEEGMAVFDGGSGLVAMGRDLKEKTGQGAVDKSRPIHIFIGHLHLDHIVGIPMFSCLFWQEANLEFYGPAGEDGSFRERLGTAMGHPYWPVSIEQVPAAVGWHEATGGEEWELPGGVRVRAMESRHPNKGLIYRLERAGESVVYGLDCEPGDPGGAFWDAYSRFAEGCSLLVYDAPYTMEEYPSFQGFGHSYWQQGLRLAADCGAKCLCISHHDWERTDEELEQMEDEAKTAGEREGIPVIFAREGRTYE